MFFSLRFESRLVDILKNIKITYDKLEGRLKAEGFKSRVLRTLKAWEDNIYPKVFMDRLHNTFLGLEVQDEPADNSVDAFDGEPVPDHPETDDDAPMDGAALLKNVMKQNYHSPSPNEDEDIDGKNPTISIIIMKYLSTLYRALNLFHALHFIINFV